MNADTTTRQDLRVALQAARLAQQAWSLVPVRKRLRVLRAFRRDLANSAEDLAALASRNFRRADDADEGRAGSIAEKLSSEVLPLAEACRFLEREAEFLLAPRREPNRLRPFWLGGVTVETRREPFGIVLIIAPGNYPLYLPGAQALQALAAGNAVLWKPAPGGRACASAMRRMMLGNGLDPALLTVLDDRAESGIEAIQRGVDKVILTGSADTGRKVMRELAATLTPSVMELSGCDAMFVLDGADLTRVVSALVFGMRLNHSATCMAPRRIFVSEQTQSRLEPLLLEALRRLKPIGVSAGTRQQLGDLVAEATLYGAKVALNGLAPNGTNLRTLDSARNAITPTVVTGAQPSMRIAQSDIFAPLLSIFTVSDTEEAIRLHDQCPYALTAAIFGPRGEAEALASRVNAGTILLNDVIVSTADPRAGFAGRKRSGFGSTRGREGLLEMTAPKTIIQQRRNSPRAYQPLTPVHTRFFAAYIALAHGRGWRARFAALRDLIRSARKLK